jgi:hypothetical protein
MNTSTTLRFPKSPWLSLLVVVLLSADGRAAAADDAGRGNARAALIDALARGGHTLSTGKESAAERFSFTLTMFVTAGGATHRNTYIVARDKEETAVVCLSEEGYPFAFLKDGLFVALDRKEPGRLVLSTTGAPRVVLSMTGQNAESLDFGISFVRSLDAPEVRLDIEKLVRGALDKATRAAHDEKTRSVRLETERSEAIFRISSPDNKGELPIAEMTLRNKKGFGVTVTSIRVGGDRAAILSVAKDAFERLRLPMHVAGEKEVLRLPLFAPPQFAADRVEREAAEKVRTLFPAIPPPKPREAAAATRTSS